jgi:methanol--5-hydroxybenzimidazolylcobamide Co-methyltransferase
MKPCDTLAICRAGDLLFGHALRPLATRRGLVNGGRVVYPELNFTLPTMAFETAALDTFEDHYRRIIAAATRRASELETPGLVVEFETVPPQ